MNFVKYVFAIMGIPISKILDRHGSSFSYAYHTIAGIAIMYSRDGVINPRHMCSEAYVNYVCLCVMSLHAEKSICITKWTYQLALG